MLRTIALSLLVCAASLSTLRARAADIPRGVPQWFKQVSTPFTYYVIKSTHNG